VQTSTPEHPAIRAAAAHDYEAFVRSELPTLDLAFANFDEGQKWFSSRLASGEYRAHLAKTLTRRLVARLTSNG